MAGTTRFWKPSSRNAPRDAFVYAVGLKACGELVAEGTAKVLHAGLLRNGFEEDDVVANCLVEYYARRGAMNIAQEIFDSIKEKNLISLNTLMAGLAFHGDTRGVFQVFEEIKQRTKWDHFHLDPQGAGLVEQGKKCFHTMTNEYRIAPDMRHYGCMIDLLGGANLMDEALEMVKSMDMKLSIGIWKSLLGAARKWNNVEVGKVAFEALLQLNQKEAGAYVVMGNIFATGDGVRKELRSEVLGQAWWMDESGGVHKADVVEEQIQQGERRVILHADSRTKAIMLLHNLGQEGI